MTSKKPPSSAPLDNASLRDTDLVGASVDSARDYAELFQLVKRLVDKGLGKSRAGIMLGLARLGLSPEGFLGGYFVMGSNAIVLNKDVLDYVKIKEPALLNPYAFHVLLHEYLHTLGYFSEMEVRPLTYELSVKALGNEHPATLIAEAMQPGARGGKGPELFRKIVYPQFGWAPDFEAPIEIVKGFDSDASPYIA
ncbi:MAG: hypothetical protein HY556_06250 [Euryarchaeota archaeon]|nr:hypothetical protein [Euryarchaeota archaeon]